MDDYYKTNALPPQEGQRQMPQQHEGQQQQQQQPSGNVIDMINRSSVSGSQMPLQPPPSAMPQLIQNQPMISGDSLDDIIRNNHTEMHRRKSMPHAYGSPLMQDENPRRMSSIAASEDVMAFDPSQHDLGNFQFSQPVGSSFHGINPSLEMTDQMGGFVTDATDYSGISADLIGPMNPPPFGNVELSQMPNEPSLSLFPPSPVPGAGSGARPMNSGFVSGQMPNLSATFGTEPAPSSSTLTATSNTLPGSIDDHPDGMMHISTSQLNAVNPPASRVPETMAANPVSSNLGQPLPHSLSRHISSESGITQPSSTSGPTPPATTSTPRESKEKTIYSKSGFDMLKALWLVATRKDPKIHLGAVDMSCAFVVCDVTMNDCPIIYVSDNFQNLTGYSRHEIVGQNCRFLQAPDGKVEAGSKREFVDDGAVYNLKNMIQEGREVQQSLINYRKGGKPFLNLLTMIPIPWDTDDIRYFIGFQIDLVECPDAISGQELGGVKVNYKHNDIGQYIWTPPASSQWQPENGQTLGVDDVSTLLQQFSPKGLVSDWHKQSWDKMLLENTDDVVHVLSLKGLFLYLSPSSKRVLEYDAIDLVGNSLSSVCHPSDIVPVTRELKDATASAQVNIVFRIRRKQSGYTWFESHGSLFVEQGKGRKCLILVGRKRPVFALSRKNLESYGGIGDSELWTKLSTSGMFLFVSSNVRSLLDLQPESLVGTSIQELMRKESRLDFGRKIETARRGKIVYCEHEVQNRRGQGLRALTILYPGDAPEGQKPSFLLAQTKLVKAKNVVLATATSNSKAASTSSQSNAVPELHSGAGQVSQPPGGGLPLGTQDAALAALAAEDNIFDELRTTKCSSWQFELRQMEKVNRILAEELGGLLSNKKKRKRRKGVGNMTGRVSPRNSSRGGNNGNGDSQSKKSPSPIHSSPLHKELASENPTSQAVVAKGDTDETDMLNPLQLGNHVSNEASESNLVQRQIMAMPPPSQPSLSSGAAGSGMTSIREEHEASQS
ncbi:hypothetical protein H633G_02195 [Metarhizium anisopliae BRIP 53284]|nr:hypothetical protein H633G_02195 [Metarhizium anisopliae BRIP 53284]